MIKTKVRRSKFSIKTPLSELTDFGKLVAILSIVGLIILVASIVAIIIIVL